LLRNLIWNQKIAGAITFGTDGDLHIELRDATGDKPEIVIVEVAADPQSCEIRNTFHTSSAKKLNVTDPPIITVIGKTFFDIGHSLKDQSKNRRKNLPGYAAWEIHPVMRLTGESR